MKEKRLALIREKLDWGPPIETLPMWTMQKIQEKCNAGSKFVVIGDFVYDIQSFIMDHPGGAKIIESEVGRDATAKFNGEVYKHSRAARNLLDRMRVAHYQKSGLAAGACIL